MQAKQHVLIAAQPAAAAVLKAMLGQVLDVTIVHTIEDGLVALQSKPGSITLVISTIAFDESRMLDFLTAVKLNAAISGTPVSAARATTECSSQPGNRSSRSRPRR